MSQFSNLKFIPIAKLISLLEEYNADSDPNKIELLVGTYRTAEGKTYVLPVVRKVERDLATDESLTHEYAPVEGTKSFLIVAARLALGRIQYLLVIFLF